MPPKHTNSANNNTPAKLKWLLILLTIIFFLLIGYIFQNNLYKNNQPTAQPQADTAPITNSPNIEPELKDSTSIAKTVQLKVPFTPQAPTANWDELHNEACEEASSIMTHAYFKGIAELPPSYVEAEIKKITEWETSTFGYYLDINTEETAQLLEEFYNLKTEIVELSEQAIKEALSENKLVIYAANGQMLGNPNFRPPGPPYHMLVITGYTDTHFITNDPGTRKGHNYTYSYDTLYAAAGDWSHDMHGVDLKDKKIIIVSKN